MGPQRPCHPFGLGRHTDRPGGSGYVTKLTGWRRRSRSTWMDICGSGLTTNKHANCDSALPDLQGVAWLAARPVRAAVGPNPRASP
jgi:hypothetical protein